LLSIAAATSGAGGIAVFSAKVSDDGVPSVLVLGAPSPVVLGSYRQVYRFALWTASSARDLTVSLTALQGRTAFTLDTGPGQDCSIARPSNVVTCLGTWSSSADGALVISAADPCANANADALRPCDPSRDWVAHGDAPYILSVLVTLSPTSFFATATQPGAAVQLTDGVPLSGVAPSAFFAQSAADGEHLSLLITARGVSVGWSATACRESVCGVGATGDALPQSGTVGAFTTVSIPQQSWCAGLLPAADPCILTVTLASSAAAPVELLARDDANQAPVDVLWPDVDGGSYTIGGNRNGTLLQVYLPGGGSGTDVVFTGRACEGRLGAAALNIWLCDPTAPIGAGACVHSFQPSATDSTAGNSTGSTGSGIATVLRRSTLASILYVSADGRDFDIVVSGAAADSPAPALVLNGGVVSASCDGDVARLAWDAAVLSSPVPNFIGPTLPALGVQYDIYLSEIGGFGPCGALSAPIFDTACGVEKWASVCSQGHGPHATVFNSIQTSLQLSGEEGDYEVILVARCNATCILASRPNGNPGGSDFVYARRSFHADKKGRSQAGRHENVEIIVTGLLALSQQCTLRTGSCGLVRPLSGRTGTSSAMTRRTRYANRGRSS
jgi:hypothetical protein